MMTKKEAVVTKLLEFDKRLTKLEEMLGLNSKNSSKPPSTDDHFKDKETDKEKPKPKK